MYLQYLRYTKYRKKIQLHVTTTPSANAIKTMQLRLRKLSEYTAKLIKVISSLPLIKKHSSKTLIANRKKVQMFVQIFRIGYFCDFLSLNVKD